MRKTEHFIEMRITPQESGRQEQYGFAFPFRVSFGDVVFPYYGSLVLFDSKKREVSPGRDPALAHYCIDRNGYDTLHEFTRWKDNWDEHWKQMGWRFDTVFPYKPEALTHMLRRAVQSWDEKSWVEEDHREADTYLPITVTGDAKIPPAYLKDVHGDTVSIDMIACLLKRGKRLMPNIRRLIMALFHANQLVMTWHVYPTVNGYRSRSIHVPIIVG